jgi:hypothetical protein
MGKTHSIWGGGGVLGMYVSSEIAIIFTSSFIISASVRSGNWFSQAVSPLVSQTSQNFLTFSGRSPSDLLLHKCTPLNLSGST